MRSGKRSIERGEANGMTIMIFLLYTSMGRGKPDWGATMFVCVVFGSSFF